MKLLVIGREGQVARALVEACGQEHVAVTAVGRPDVDLVNPDTIGRAIEGTHADAVVNAAAFTAVDKAEAERDTAFAVNADGVRHLARVCHARRLPLIHVSTDYVFDGRSERPYRETDATGPISVYGASKLAGERAIAEETDLAVVLRTSWVYSVHGHNFLKTMLRLAEERDEVRVVDDQRGTPTSADDIARAIIGICRSIGDNSRSNARGVFHYTGQGDGTWHDFAGRVFERLQAHGLKRPRLVPISTREFPTPAARPRNSRLDCTRYDTTFTVPRREWRTAVEETVDCLVLRNGSSKS